MDGLGLQPRAHLASLNRTDRPHAVKPGFAGLPNVGQRGVERSDPQCTKTGRQAGAEPQAAGITGPWRREDEAAPILALFRDPVASPDTVPGASSSVPPSSQPSTPPTSPASTTTTVAPEDEVVGYVPGPDPSGRCG